jgi:hypothetical protein
MVQRMPADEVAPKKLTLQLDLEKPSLGDEKSPSERRPQPALQQQKPKNEIKHEKSGKNFAIFVCKFGSFGFRNVGVFSSGIHPLLQQCLLLHHLCRYLLEVGWGVFHHLGEFSWLIDVLHSCPQRNFCSKACCFLTSQLPRSCTGTISCWSSSSYGCQARVFCWITGLLLISA